MKKILISFILICSIASAKYPIYLPFDGYVNQDDIDQGIGGEGDIMCLANIVNGVNEGYCMAGKSIEAKLFDEDYRTDGACTLIVYNNLLAFEPINMKILRAGTLLGYAKTIEEIKPVIHRYDCRRVRGNEKSYKLEN